MTTRARIEHGRSAYVNHGCRCGICTEANTDYFRAYNNRPRRYPLQALVDAAGTSEAALAKRVGLSGSTLKAARENGLREDAADRYAIRAGLVPWLVWGDWLEDVGRICAADGCDRRFVPVEHAQHMRYCSPRCRNRMKKRRHRATAHGAEVNRRHRRNYYAENSSYENERRKRQRRAA